jgi:hypothetical protein
MTSQCGDRRKRERKKISVERLRPREVCTEANHAAISKFPVLHICPVVFHYAFLFVGSGEVEDFLGDKLSVSSDDPVMM